MNSRKALQDCPPSSSDGCSEKRWFRWNRDHVSDHGVKRRGKSLIIPWIIHRSRWLNRDGWVGDNRRLALWSFNGVSQSWLLDNRSSCGFIDVGSLNGESTSKLRCKLRGWNPVEIQGQCARNRSPWIISFSDWKRFAEMTRALFRVLTIFCFGENDTRFDDGNFEYLKYNMRA